MSDFSVIIISHNKPVFIKEAVQCLLDQTHGNWDALLIDSGVLYHQGFFGFVKDDRIRVIPSNETKELVKRVNITAWCFNYALNSCTLPGELLLYLCDDDYYLPNAFQTFWDYYLRYDRKPQAMYSSERWEFLNHQSKVILQGNRYADLLRGSSCQGHPIHSQVDYLQVCHTRAILKQFQETYKTSEFYSESMDHYQDADSVFLERIGALTPFYPLEEILSVHRHTAISAHYPPTPYSVFRSWMYLKKQAVLHQLHRWTNRNQKLTP